ncbi:hypothetical protein GCM10017781_14160 [Deinococcus metalli]|uniref:Uncharacterized protein n=1 Tax=Deinococcus metalli TaxID=1141878 RepID=A0ABQ3JLZ8_9DEIO|nr:hypothetical protein GCM10017781_14160 [Deinococcus metalli]
MPTLPKRAAAAASGTSAVGAAWIGAAGAGIDVLCEQAVSRAALSRAVLRRDWGGVRSIGKLLDPRRGGPAQGGMPFSVGNAP